ncbi:unnamed protein product [Rangifer tarandus platyrhynchus]|uniref:Uncharacterized protein n=2 Tax=Rangifer tarandus platyrhynchus TaxID=3082113 RepID=A0ACB0DZS1_RANTA|nr:unnamed protein product [Rangifer tarandus platyrhynchus]CAI9693746.1 unnamed protein product [Rangifer tarandus platyrhynchus]
MITAHRKADQSSGIPELRAAERRCNRCQTEEQWTWADRGPGVGGHMIHEGHQSWNGGTLGGGRCPEKGYPFTGSWLQEENGARRVQGPEGALELRVSPSVLSRVLQWEHLFWNPLRSGGLTVSSLPHATCHVEQDPALSHPVPQ